MEFKFTHDILAGTGVRPIIDGEVKIKVTRTKIFVFTTDEENWEKNEIASEPELAEYLRKADAKFGWQEVEATNEFEIRNRFSALMVHGELRREVDDRGENLSDVETVVTMMPGGSFTYGYSVGTDEGHHSSGYEVLWNGENGWNVSVTHSGSDCDGRHSHTTDYAEDVNGNPITEERTEVYDEFAQAMNY